MKIDRRGRITLPKALREQAGLRANTEFEFEVLANGDVLMRRVRGGANSVRAAFERVRASANASQFKGMGTGEFMTFLRD